MYELCRVFLDNVIMHLMASAQYLAPSECSNVVIKLVLNLGIKIGESRYRHVEIMSR